MADTLSVISVTDSLPPNKQEDNPQFEKDENTKDISDGVSYWNILYFLVIVAGGFAAVCIVTLIPRHNTIFYPEFWYEPMILFTVTICLRLTFATILELYIFTNVSELLSRKIFLKLLFAYSMSFILPYCICYTTWTIYLGRNHPLPFIGAFGYCVYPVYAVGIWYLFPPERRVQDNVKRNMPYFILFRFSWLAFDIVSTSMKIILNNLSHIEWLPAVLIPIVRSVSSWIFLKIVKKIIGGTNDAANCLVSTTITMSFSFYIAMQLMKVSQFTVNCILCVELMLHMTTCYQIIRLSRRVEGEAINEEKESINEERRNKISDLAISELLESMIPFISGLAYASAYFGPNANLIRNVGSNFFGGTIIEDIEYFYIVMLELFTVDLIAMILSTACLHYFCNINLIQEFCKTLKKYWWMMMLQLSVAALYFGYNDINFGLDFTFNFQWITEKGRYDLIIRSEELSEDEKAMLLQNETLK